MVAKNRYRVSGCDVGPRLRAGMRVFVKPSIIRLAYLLLLTLGVCLGPPPAMGAAGGFPIAPFSACTISSDVESALKLAQSRDENGGLAGEAASVPEQDANPSRIIVRFKPDNPRSPRVDARTYAQAVTSVKAIRAVDGLTVLEVPPSQRDAVMASYAADPDVMYVEQDYTVRVNAIPNDGFFDLQWGLQNVGQDVLGESGVVGADIAASQAWDIWTGDPTFKIAVIDTGIDYTHVDLAGNVWTNPGEVPGNGIDDDGNGWIDDVHGYDTINDDGDPFDDHGHGTHMSGIIGAIGDNGIGIAGVNWKCQIVAIKAFGPDGTASISDIIEAMQYVIDNGLRLSNNSFAGDQFSQAMRDMIEASQSVDHLFIAAVGNQLGRNIDDFPVYPASYNLLNILTVTATTNNDILSFVTNFGPFSVDIGAPGHNILSTLPGDAFAYATGSSMAAAHVTGVAGLLWSRLPTLAWQDVRLRILATPRRVDALIGRAFTGGVVDATSAVGDCNRTGIPDDIEIQTGASVDCNDNGLPDECETDCNGNGIHDRCDINDGISEDCNGNFTPDECEIDDGSADDCNANGKPDQCDVATGESPDVNQTGIPDECELCFIDADCSDGDGCTDESCVSDLCFFADNVASCDDGRDCTENDACAAGQCVGSPIPSLECSPLFTVKATAINDEPLAGGPMDSITADRGDRIAVDFFVERWSPRNLQGYNFVIDPASYISGATGRIEPVVVPDAQAGAFVDQTRPDFMFFDSPTITIVQNSDIAFYQYISIVIFLDECAADTDQPAYLGTVILDVSDTASGKFQLCLDGDLQNRTFLIDCPVPALVEPVSTECLTIDVPLSGCGGSPDCNGNGMWDVCDIANGLVVDCNRNDVPDDCDLTAGTSQDCNGNGEPDDCDIAGDVSMDCDSNGIPDECEPDCNGNALTDACDILDGTSPDCNVNGVPDECDVGLGSSKDCDAGVGNGIPDECEADCNTNQIADSCDIEVGASLDDDFNTVPDSCQVDRLVPADFPTIQAAIDAANPGDTVLVADGTYSGAGNFNLDLRGKIITVRSANGPAACILDGQGAGSGFLIERGEDSRTRVEGFTITDGAFGVKVENAKDPVVRDCVLTNHFGAAINLFRCEAVFERCIVRDNPASLTSWSVLTTPTFSHCSFLSNETGGIFLWGSDAIIRNCLIADNASSVGGAIHIQFSKPVIENCTIADNEGDFAGAIFARESDLTIRNTVFWNNSTISIPTEYQSRDVETIYLARSSVFFEYTNLAGGIGSVFETSGSTTRWGQGVVNVNPVFQKQVRDSMPEVTTVDDYLLTPLSPFVDLGDPAFSASAGQLDIEGEPRLMLSRIDLGVDEIDRFDDCNKNGVPDGWDIGSENNRDCNLNFVPDECDLNDGTGVDLDGNGVLDECEPSGRDSPGAMILRGSDSARPQKALAE